MLTNYPNLTQGKHEIIFENDHICLNLIFDDINNALSNYQSNYQINAWFLDGFSPSKNPEMWQQSMFNQMYNLSTSNTTVATYTVAGVVRRGLTEAGFNVSRKPGFGTKRDMLFAIKE